MSTIAAPAPPSRRSVIRLRVGGLVHEATAGVVAGGIAGALAGGVGGRLAMRVTALMSTDAEQGSATEAGETVGQISLDGTLALIVFGGVLIGMLGGLLYVAVARWVADAGSWRGLVFGAGLLIALGWAVIEGDNFDFAGLGSITVNVAMFSAIYLLFGIIVAPLYTWIRRWLHPPSWTPRGVLSLPVYLFGTLFALITLLITATAFGEGGREAPMYAILPGYLLIVTTGAAWLLTREARRFDRLSDLRQKPKALASAVAVVAVPLLAGAALDIQSLAEMLGDAR